MALMNVGHVIVEILKAEGVKCFFGLPGGHTLSIYDGLYHNADVIRSILVRHEQVAPNMAAAYAQLTGEPGVCCATAGPGATNMVSGIAEAYYGALPVIVLTARGGTRDTIRGGAQEIEQEKLFAPITKWSVRVDRADMVPETLRHAFNLARSGRPGPVLIDLPIDIVLMQSIEFSAADYVPVGKPDQPEGNPATVESAVDELLRAKRPLIVAGGGTAMSGAFEQVRKLAETLAIPVITTLSGRGAIPEDHPLACGGMGMHRNRLSKKVLIEADYVLGLGCRFEPYETNWKPDWLPAENACYVQVDTNASEMGKSILPNITIVGDIKLVLDQMQALLVKKGAPDYQNAYTDQPRIKAISALKNEVEAQMKQALSRDDKPMFAGRVVRQVRETFPRNTTISVDVGCLAQAMGGGFPYTSVHESRSVICCTSFYCMGFASSAAPVAKLVYPDRPAVAFCGDGSFQMITHVLPVAAEYGLPVTWVILNNECYGSIRDVQEALFESRYIATDFKVKPDFTAIARACQCYGERIDDPAQVKPALERALIENNKGIPAVLDFRVSREEPPEAVDYFANI